jgi:hypothetical protein
MRLPLLLLATLFPTVGMATTPTLPALSPDQEHGLAKGQVLILDDFPARNERSFQLVGMLDIDAPMGAVWSVVTDYKQRERASNVVQSVNEYHRKTLVDVVEFGLRWELKIFGEHLTYHNRMKADQRSRTLEWWLDDSKENDLVYNGGGYLVMPHPENPSKSRLVTWTETDTGRKIPKWVRVWASKSGLRDLLKKMRVEAVARRS